MRLRFGWVIAIVATLIFSLGGVRAAAAADASTPPQMSGWLEKAVGQIEAEAADDFAALSDIPEALSREWRSFDHNGSALGTLAGIGWVALATLAGLGVERGVAQALSRRARRRMEIGEDGPTLVGLIALLVCDLIGLAAFLAVFATARRHFFPVVGVTDALAGFATAVLLRWRIVAVVVGAILRPGEPVARLIEISDIEAHRLARYLSGSILAIILLVGFGRYGLMDEDSGAVKPSRNSPGQADARSKKEITIKGASAAPSPSGAGGTNLKTRSDAVNADAGVSLTGTPVTRPDKVLQSTM